MRPGPQRSRPAAFLLGLFLAEVVLLGLLAVPAAAQPARTAPGAAEPEAVLRARALAAAGETKEAEELLREARAAQAAAPPRGRAELALAHADLLARSGDDDPEARMEAERAYDQAVELGDPRQVATAHNNRGVLLLATGSPERAVESLRRTDPAALAPALRPLHRYNLGRALERTGETAPALETYLEAVRLDPSYGPAIRRAAGLLEQRTGTAAMEDAAALGRLLLEAGQHQRFETEWTPLLSRHPEPATLALYARHLAARPPECDGGDWRPIPGRSGSDGGKLERWMRELWQAVCPSPLLASSADPEALVRAATEAFPTWWSDPESAAALADLMVALGDRDRRSGDPDRALARYFVAWRFDDGNALAAQRCAVVIEGAAAAGSPLPLEPRRAIVEALLEAAAEGEGGDLWLQTHLLLADFLAQGGDGEEAISGQLRRALRAERDVVGAGGRPSPGLHLRIASAAGEERPGVAVGALVSAARAYLEHDDPRRAGEVVDRAEALAGLAGIPAPPGIEEVRKALADAWVAQGRPELDGGTPVTGPGGGLCVCGRFPRPEHAFALLLDGEPLSPDRVRLQGDAVFVKLPPDLPPGRHRIRGDPAAGYGDEAAWSFDRVELEVVLEEAGLLGRKRSRRVVARVEGSRQRLTLTLVNQTPEIFRLSGGEELELTTSGGDRNRATTKGRFLRPGTARVTAYLLPRCPCAGP